MDGEEEAEQNEELLAGRHGCGKRVQGRSVDKMQNDKTQNNKTQNNKTHGLSDTAVVLKDMLGFDGTVPGPETRLKRILGSKNDGAVQNDGAT